MNNNIVSYLHTIKTNQLQSIKDLNVKNKTEKNFNRKYNKISL